MSKVFFLLTALSVGGGERVASDLSLYWPQSQDLSIVLLDNKISYPYHGSIVTLNIPELRNIILKIYFCFSALSKFRKLVQKENPNYIVSFGKLPNLINLFAGSKAVLRVDNFYSASCIGFSGWIYKLLVGLLFNKAEKVVVISKESADDLIKNFGLKKEKVEVIYNPLNIEQIQKLAREPLDDDYKNIFFNSVIITMGQLGKQKNQTQLIKAFNRVKADVKDAKLVILGNGPDENRLKNIVKELQLEKDVYFLGWQKNPFKFIANAKIFVLSSLWEGLPCSLLEAMALKVPVVSFDCSSGPREILAPDTNFLKKTDSIEYTDFGVLVKPESERMLSEAIIRVLSDESLRNDLKEKLSQRTKDFDIPKIIKEWNFLQK